MATQVENSAATTGGAHPKALIDKYFKWLIGIVVVLVLLFGLKHYVNTPSSSSGCVAGHPCEPMVNDDGSSEPFAVPTGKTVCFEPWAWKHMPELGLMVSLGDPKSVGEPFPCSTAEVFAGSCVAVYDHFWFKPRHKTKLPKHWFVNSGARQCS